MDSYNTTLVPDPANVRLLKRIGRMAEIRPECLVQYRTILADGSAAIRELLIKHQLRNFSIFISQCGNRWFMYSYCEYVGRDYDADMDALAKDVGYQEWMRTSQPMHVSTDADFQWRQMEQVFFNP